MINRSRCPRAAEDAGAGRAVGGRGRRPGRVGHAGQARGGAARARRPVHRPAQGRPRLVPVQRKVIRTARQSEMRPNA